MMQNHLSRFEDQIQRLVEGGFARLFAGRLHPLEVAVQLAHSMEDYAREQQDGQQVAPDIYIVRLNPDDHTAILDEQPDLTERLASELVDMARSAGLLLHSYPEIRLLVDEHIEPHRVAIGARHSSPHGETTEAMPLSQIEEAIPPVPRAALIINGERTVPINRPILNLGRHRDNHIIINDSSVSRHHAQIRLRFGQYVLFDLSSSGGTSVNGHPVREAPLRPGDVITLAGNTSLIYVEDNANFDHPDAADGPTQALSPTTKSE